MQKKCACKRERGKGRRTSDPWHEKTMSIHPIIQGAPEMMVERGRRKGSYSALLKD